MYRWLSRQLNNGMRVLGETLDIVKDWHRVALTKKKWFNLLRSVDITSLKFLCTPCPLMPMSVCFSLLANYCLQIPSENCMSCMQSHGYHSYSPTLSFTKKINFHSRLSLLDTHHMASRIVFLTYQRGMWTQCLIQMTELRHIRKYYAVL